MADNPSHIIHGFAVDNTRDMLERKRYSIRKGENNTQAKLTDEQIIAIRRLLESGELLQYEIAAIFGISKGHVSAIKLGKVWTNEEKHIQVMLNFARSKYNKYERP